MNRQTYGGTIACVCLVACLSCVSSAADAELTFVPDPGVRLDHAGLASPSYDEEAGLFYLYYEDEGTHRQLVATSQDGLSFGLGAVPSEWLHDPRILVMPQPDEEGRTIYRRYIRQPDSAFVSESSSDGRRFTRDEGIRYQPRSLDLPVGVYDHFADSLGGIVLLYIGDMYGVNNVRRAYSAPESNGWTFRFEDDDPLGDADLGGGPNSYVDQKSILLPDGRRRLFVMKQGSIYSFISQDDGAAFTLEPGARLTPASFGDLRIRSLHDPWPILLPDGRIRIYLHGFVDDGSSPHNVILSATQEEG